MAVNTWDGASDTNWNDAANWNTTGVTDRVPTADDDVVIANVSNNCVMPDGLNPTINSLLVESGGHLTAGNNNITIDSHPASGTNRPIDLSGTFVKGTSTLTFTYSAAETKFLNFRGVEVHNVDISGANTTFAIGNGALTASGNLNITAGTLDTFSAQNNALTVTGNIAGNGTLTANASTVTVTGQTTVNTLNITSGTYNYFDDFKPTTCNITDNATFNQTSIGGKFGGRIIITASKTPTFNAVGRLDSTFDIQSGEQGNSTFNLDLSEPQTGPSRALFFHNLELDSQNTENNTFTMAGAITCTGDLTVTDGKIDTGSTGRAINVNGKVSVASGGALDLDAASSDANYSFGSLTIANGGIVDVPSHGTITITNKNSSNYIIQIAGLFNHNGGTVKIDTSVTGDKLLDLIPSSGVGLNHLIVNEDGSGVVQYNGNTTIAGNLTIEEGIFQFYDNNNSNLTVSGNVSIEDGGQLGAAGWVGAGEFGSLTIASGGTYQATRGTTTITGEGDGSSGTNGFAWYNDNATFTHNKGKVVIDTAGNNHTLVAENTFYDLEINQTSSVYEMKLRPSNNGGTANKILNNFTLTSGIFEKNNASDTLDIFGLTNISANGKFMEDANENTNTITHHGLVTNSGTYKINDGTTVKMNGGIRNLGTITVA